ncbi:sensor histidine kinase [Dactylosporangium aurantiacum]|uniref:histidine kinase n=1 Tax=Dactylosporangium aurantiacum TaxID=35754 RepID=A0A9Q9MRD5_9ACTN|nr:sensor histidine kinase [Dactylosporangium aurantiacum]MDG6110011.1 sensor histidine kinase [Dactylosporangium aurantiacum]UWZ58407.1 sensor histidine kinase [Dactylosporangium aurantiacum]
MSDPASPTRPPASLVWTVLAWCGAAAYPVVLLTLVPVYRGTLLPMLALLLPTGLLRRYPLPVLALMLAGSWLVTVTTPVWGVAYSQVLAVDVALAVTAAAWSRRVSLAAAALVVAVQVAAVGFYATGDQLYRSTVAIVALTGVAAWAIGNSTRQRREHAAEMTAQATERAVAAERLHIARELHDMVAHSVGIIAIQAGMGARVIDSRPDEARLALRTIEATSRETLAGLRLTLVSLRRPAGGAGPDTTGDVPPRHPAPGLADLDRLVASTVDAGVRVELSRCGEQRLLPPEVELSAYRIVQEALTNVVRHAGAARCRVTVDYGERELSVEVADDGPGHGDAAAAPGFGLAGLRERAAILGGELSAGPRPGGGFRVFARLPTTAGVA